MKNSVLSSCTLKRIKLKCEVCGDNFYSDVIKYECRKCKNFHTFFTQAPQKLKIEGIIRHETIRPHRY